MTPQAPKTVATDEEVQREFDQKREIDEEAKKWAEIGLNPMMCNPDPIKNGAELKTILKILVDKGIVTEKELNEIFRQQILTLMQEVRTQFESQRKDARNSRRLNQPGASLYGPDGKPLIH